MDLPDPRRSVADHAPGILVRLGVGLDDQELRVRAVLSKRGLPTGPYRRPRFPSTAVGIGAAHTTTNWRSCRNPPARERRGDTRWSSEDWLIGNPVVEKGSRASPMITGEPLSSRHRREIKPRPRQLPGQLLAHSLFIDQNSVISGTRREVPPVRGCPRLFSGRPSKFSQQR